LGKPAHAMSEHAYERARVEPGNPHKVMLGPWEIGSAKLHCDALLHMYKINEIIDAAYKTGLEVDLRRKQKLLEAEMEFQTKLMKTRLELEKVRTDELPHSE
jgi:hypothetical protein